MTDLKFHLGYILGPGSKQLDVMWPSSKWPNVNNPHISISGQSGTGKSFLLKNLILQAASQGALCLVFDYSSDFCDYVPPKGQRFQLIDLTSSAFALNPLTGSSSPAIRAQQLVASLHSIFRTGPRAPIALQKATVEYLTTDDTPSLPGLLAYISNQEHPEKALLDAKAPLELLSSLIHCGNQPISLDLNSPGLVVLDFSGIVDPNICNSLINLILQTLWITHSQEDPPLILVFDEAHHLNWGTGSMAVRILREGRKFRIAGWFSSQWIDHSEAESALGQAALQIHFRPDERHVNKLAKMLAPSRPSALQQYRNLILGLHRGQFLWQHPSGQPIIVEVGSSTLQAEKTEKIS